MAQRKRLGIRFNFSYITSTGAAIYFQNIIRSLDILSDEKKPEVYVFVSPDAPFDDIRSINYPYMTIFPIRYLPVWKRVINRLYRSLTKGKKFNLLNASTYLGGPNGQYSSRRCRSQGWPSHQERRTRKLRGPRWSRPHNGGYFQGSPAPLSSPRPRQQTRHSPGPPFRYGSRPVWPSFDRLQESPHRRH